MTVGRAFPCSSRASLPSVMLLFLCVVMATGKILKNDPNCLKIGGLCVDLETCPPRSRVNQTGLCAQEQQREGVCCHELPTDSTCRESGGVCRKDCRHAPNVGQRDCETGKSCCVLIF